MDQRVAQDHTEKFDTIHVVYSVSGPHVHPLDNLMRPTFLDS